jgi:hypothetical protein
VFLFPGGLALGLLSESAPKRERGRIQSASAGIVNRYRIILDITVPPSKVWEEVDSFK